jgi:hypothetical protein
MTYEVVAFFPETNNTPQIRVTATIPAMGWEPAIRALAEAGARFWWTEYDWSAADMVGHPKVPPQRVTVTMISEARETTLDLGPTPDQSPPTVLTVTPNTGPRAGGTLVTITGRGFTGVTDIAFGSGWAAPLTHTDETVTCHSPIHSTAALVDVTVWDGYRSRELGTLAQAFTYT